MSSDFEFEFFNNVSEQRSTDFEFYYSAENCLRIRQITLNFARVLSGRGDGKTSEFRLRPSSGCRTCVQKVAPSCESGAVPPVPRRAAPPRKTAKIVTNYEFEFFIVSQIRFD